MWVKGQNVCAPCPRIAHFLFQTRRSALVSVCGYGSPTGSTRSVGQTVTSQPAQGWRDPGRSTRTINGLLARGPCAHADGWHYAHMSGPHSRHASAARDSARRAPRSAHDLGWVKHMLRERITQVIDNSVAACNEDMSYQRILELITNAVMMEVGPLTVTLPIVPAEDVLV